MGNETKMPELFWARSGLYNYAEYKYLCEFPLGNGGDSGCYINNTDLRPYRVFLHEIKPYQLDFEQFCQHEIQTLAEMQLFYTSALEAHKKAKNV
jgi:hypothetical protein